MASIYDKASLVLIPSGTKTSKVYSQKPTNGDGDFTFSRSTAATRVNASGNIEKETQNLITYSNDFSQTPWLKYLISLTSGQSGYDGTSNAWLIEKSGAYGNVYRNISNSGVYVWSVYAKAGSFDFLALRFRNTSNQYRTAFFDLSTGTLGSVDSNIIKHTIEDVGGGWYRCQITFNDPAINQVMIYPSDANNGIANAGTGNIYIQDAQLEQGLVARDYIETTTTAIYGGITDNVPRLDYTDSSCPALLLEPQRTNIVPQSEYLGGWSAINCSVTANSITSPEGVTNSFKITENSAASTQHRVAIGVSSTSAIHTMSAYVKNSSGSRMAYIDMGPVTGHFNFATETMYSPQGTANWEDAGNGWYRISITSNTAVTPVTAFAGLSVNNSETYSGDGSSAIEFYGIQLEAGSYATSYIPTYGSAVTRNGDMAEIIPLSTNIIDTSLAHSGFIEINANSIGVLGYQVWGIDDGSYNNFIKLYIHPSSKNLRLAFKDSAGILRYGDYGASGQYSKFAWTYDGVGQFKIFVNGSLTNTYGVSINSFSRFGYGEKAGDLNYTNTSTKQILLFPTALTDQEAIDLTTL